jgi:hypothetical protein
VEDFQDLLFLRDSIVDVERRMKNAPHSGKSFDGPAEAGKAPQKIHVVEKCQSEAFRCGRVVLPGPRQDLLQID